MERLTDFELEQWDNQNPFWNVNIRKLIDEVKAYRQLEKEIGCPLDIKCELYSNKTIYTAEGDSFLITDLFYDLFQAEAEYDFRTKEFKYSDYKKTWWTKADKSE